MKVVKRISVKCGDHSHIVKADGTSMLPVCLINTLFRKKGDQEYIEVLHISCKGVAFYSKHEDIIGEIHTAKLLNGASPQVGTILTCGTCKKPIGMGSLFTQRSL